jgi:hypothetical protein
MAALTGGDKLMAYLATINQRVLAAGTDPHVNVGFLEGATYPDGTSVPMIAAQNEFGGTIQIPARTVTVYRKRAASGTRFLRKGRFVKRSQSNFPTEHAVGAYSITIPPRPFFRNMIKKYGPGWGAATGVLLKQTDYDVAKVLSQMGQLIKGQLQQSILSNTPPPNEPSTVRRKGHDQTLIDSHTMLNAVDYEVST